jgi:hypothetical protein
LVSRVSFHTTGFVSLGLAACFTPGVAGATLGGNGMLDAVFCVAGGMNADAGSSIGPVIASPAAARLLMRKIVARTL